MAGTFPGGDPGAQRSWQIIDALRRYGTDSARLGHAFAARHRLQPADLRALVAIMAAEGSGRPLTPGRLREHLQLSAGGTSIVIDRLESAGHVRRSRDHPADNRVVHLHYTDRGMTTAQAFFAPLGARTQAVIDDFDDAELLTIGRFLDAAAEALHDHLGKLDDESGSPDS